MLVIYLLTIHVLQNRLAMPLAVIVTLATLFITKLKAVQILNFTEICGSFRRHDAARTKL